ncbi:hypothetical protein ABPG72_019882 [Tetrahymena utriculariae]
MERFKSPNNQRKLNAKNVSLKQSSQVVVRKPTASISLKESAYKIINLYKLIGENGENQGELKISLELFSKKVLLSKEIEQLEPEFIEQIVKIINKYSFQFAQKAEDDIAYNLLDCSLRLLQNSLYYENQEQQTASTLQNMGSIIAKVGQNTLAKKIFKYCLKRFYDQEVSDFQDRYESIRKLIEKKDGHQISIPSQLQCNLTMNQKIQNGILLNNLSSIYLSEKKYEKALYLATSCSYDLEGYVFEQRELQDTEDLKNDPEFQQRIIILLNSYLNMGRAQENIGRLIKDVQEYSSKFLYFEQAIKSYANGYKFSKTYLGVEDRSFFSIFQASLNQLRKEKEENYVKSFQSQNQISYGSGYLDQTIEKRIVDFLNLRKRIDNDKQILNNLHQTGQYQIQTDRPSKHFHIGKPKKQPEVYSSSFNGIKSQQILHQNTSLRGNQPQKNMVQSPLVYKQLNSLSSSQKLFQNTQKGNSLINSKRQIALHSSELFNATNTHNMSTVSNNNNNQNGNGYMQQALQNNNNNNNNTTTNNQNNSMYSNQEEIFNFQNNNNNNHYNNQNSQTTLLSQRQFSVPTLTNPALFNKNILGLQNGSQGQGYFDDSHRNSTPLIQNPVLTPQQKSSSNSFFPVSNNLAKGYSNQLANQQIFDQSVQSQNNGISPLQIFQNQQSQQSPQLNQLHFMNSQSNSLSSQNQQNIANLPNSQVPLDSYFPSNQYSPINQIQSAQNLVNSNPYSYSLIPGLNQQSQSLTQYNLNNNFIPQAHEQLLFLQQQQQQQNIQAAAMQGFLNQPQQFINQNFFQDNSHPAFQALHSQMPIDPNLFDKNALMDDQSEKGDDEHVQPAQTSNLKYSQKQPTAVLNNNTKAENLKPSQSSETALSNKASENSFKQKEKDNSNEMNDKSKKNNNQKEQKQKQDLEKYNQIQGKLNQQDEKVRQLETQLSSKKIRKSEDILQELQPERIEEVTTNLKTQKSKEKVSSLRFIQMSQVNQDKKSKSNQQNGNVQTNSSNTNGNNYISTLSSIGYDFSPEAANKQSRGKNDFKVTVNNELGSEVLINGGNDQSNIQPASFNAVQAAANTLISQQNSTNNSSINNKAFLKSGQSSIDNQSQNTLSFRNQQMNRILEEDSYDTSISPNMRQTAKSSFHNSGQTSSQKLGTVAVQSPMSQQNNQPQKATIYNTLDKKHQQPILRNRRSSKSLDNSQNQDEEEQNQQIFKLEVEKSKIKNQQADESFSLISQQQDENVKRQPAKRKTLLQKHKSVNFQDDNNQNEISQGENNLNMYSSVEKRMKQNSVHYQTYTALVTSPNQPKQYNNIIKKIPNIEEMMKNGAKKAHAWKFLEVSSEYYRLNVDLNETDITLWASNLKTTQQIAKQIISLSNLQTLLEYVEYQDILPNQKPLKSITTIEDFLTHFILPFMTIQNKNVSLQPKPIGLVEKDWQIKFLNTECDVSFHHIVGNQFRIIFTCIHRKDQFKVDLEVDDFMKAELFENMDDGNKYLDKIKDIVHLYKKKKNILDITDEEISSLKSASDQTMKQKTTKTKKQDEEDEDEDDDDFDLQGPFNANIINSKDFNKFLDKYDKNRIELVTIESLRIKKLSDFTSLFLREIENIDTFLQRELIIKDINLFNLRFSNKILKLHVYKEQAKNQVRGKITYVYEDQAKQVFCIKIKNTFETFAPYDTKEQSKGYAEIKFVDLWKEYGVQYDTLDASDKICICNFISKQYYIYTFEKQLEEDDYGRYSTNLIKKKNIVQGSFQRILVGHKYHKQIVTMCYMGLEDEPLGIKVTIYDPLRCEEKGIMITLEDKLYKKTQAELDLLNLNSNGKKKRTKKYKDSYTINSDFHIVGILKAFGWRIMLEIIQTAQDKINRVSSIRGPVLGDKNSSFYRLESLVNPQNIIKFFQTKNMYLYQNQN